MRYPITPLIIRLLLCLFPVLSFAQWKPVYHGTETTDEITGISFYSPSDGYIAATHYIGYTTDSGKSFQKKFITPGNVDFGNRQVNLTFGFVAYCIKAFDQNKIVVGGDYGLEPAILYSSNGGVNWKLVYHRNIPVNTTNIYNKVHAIHFINTTTGIAVQNDEMIRTTDGGLTWISNYTIPNAEMTGISFGDAVTGYMIAKSGMYKTNDGGISWFGLNSVPDNRRKVSFVSASTGYLYCGGQENQLYKTSNGGATWQLASDPGIFSLEARDMLFINSNTGFISTEGYEIYKTSDAGKTWEKSKQSPQFSYLGYGYEKIYFFNQQLGWAGGYHDYLAMTTTGGEPTLPAAYFKVNKDNFCTTGAVQLDNFSRSGYTYQWFLNDSLISSSYNTSYLADASPYDTIMLVVNNGTDTDTALQVIEAQALGAFTFISRPQADTICKSQNFFFEIPDSDPNTYYRLYAPTYGTIGNYGNGGLLKFSIQFNDTASEGTYRVEATRYSNCGAETKSNYHTLYFLTTFINVTAQADTICTGKEQYVKVLNSIKGYEYWVEHSSHVAGTGGEILLPLSIPRHEAYRLPGDRYPEVTLKIFAKHSVWGCGSIFPSEEVTMVIRNPVSRMHIVSNELKTGQSITAINASYDVQSYLWTASGTGVVNNNNTRFQPSDLYFSQPGNYDLTLIATSKEGCSDTIGSKLVVYDAAAFSDNSIAVCSEESTSSNYFYKALDSYTDGSGNQYLTGAKMKLNGFFDTKGLEGWFLIKKDRNGLVVWEKNNLINVGAGHIVTENVIVDQYENIYLYGHLFRDRYAVAPQYYVDTIFFGGGSTIAFVTKLNKHGKVVWMRTASNASVDPNFYPTDETRSFAAGSLVMGKNNELFLKIASNYPRYHFGDTVIRGGVDEAYLFHFDQDGKLLHHYSFPSKDASWDIKTNNLDVYHHAPRMKFNAAGDLVFTGVLDSTRTIASFEGVPLSFDTRIINTALFVYDTTQKRFKSVLPIFKVQDGVHSGAVARTFEVDDQGNYYITAFNRTLDTLRPEANWAYPKNLAGKKDFSYKLKTYLSKFNAQGNLVWQKLVDGFKPVDIIVDNNQLLFYGENFQTDYHRLEHHSYNGDIGVPVYHANNDTLFVGYPSPQRRKISYLTSDAGEKFGAEGIGGIDLLQISMNADGSGTQLNTLGGLNDERLYRVVKDSCGNIRGFGYKDLVARPGPSSWHSYNNTNASMVTWKFTGSAGCNGTPCANPKPALRFEKLTSRYRCVDTVAKLFWSASNIQQVTISFSKNGGAYQSLVQNYPADSLNISYNPKTLNLTGNIIFRIQSSIDPSLTDTIATSHAFPPQKSLLGRDTLMCYYDTTTITSIEGPYHYKWNGGSWNEGISTHIPPNAAGEVGVTITDTITGCQTYDYMRISRTPYFPQTHIVVEFSSNERIVTTECGITHQWRLNGQLLPDTGCVLIPRDTGTYSVATYKDGCVSSIYSGAWGYFKVTTLPEKIKWVRPGLQTHCTDSMYLLKWTASVLINKVNIRVQTANQANQLIAVDVDAAIGEYLVDLRNYPEGNFKFLIESSSNNLLFDTMTIRAGVKPVVNLGNDLVTCAGSAHLLSGPLGNGYQYLWNTGATTRMLTVPQAGITEYTLTVASLAGCTDADTMHIRVNEVPQPSIYTDTIGKYLTTGFCGMTHRWFRDDQEITGVSGCQLEAKQSGKYRVLLVDSSGCASGMSDTFLVEKPAQRILIGPNPASSEINVAIDLPQQVAVSIALITREGAVVFEKNYGPQPAGMFKTSIQLAAVSKSGLYLLRTIAGDEVTTKQVVIIR